jgi:hypothetical protein
MKVARITLGIFLILFGVGMVLCSREMNGGAKKYEFIGEYEQTNGVVVAIHGGVSKYSWYWSLWHERQREAQANGGMKLFAHMSESGDDWMGVHLFVPAGDTLVLDPQTDLFITMPDSQTLRSKEIVLTETPGQHYMFSSKAQKIVLTAEVGRYWKAQNGAFVAFVRYPAGTLDLNHDLSVEKAGMPVPIDCWIYPFERR